MSVINYTENIFADVYLITEHGDLYNLDGCNNRIALLLQGANLVMIVAVINKIVRDLDELIK